MATPDERVLDEQTSDHLKAHGFDPGIEVCEIEQCGLTIDDLKGAVFGHRWDNPKLLVIHEGGTGLRIPVVLHRLTVVWRRYESARHSEQVSRSGVNDEPDYYVVGRPIRHCTDEPLEIRAYFERPAPDGKLSHVYIQEVSTPSGVDSSTPLRYTSA